MTTTAKLAARLRDSGSVWIDHAAVVDDDFEWLADVERLTLWNVKIPTGFLSRLKRLWWVDWRGGGKGQQIEQLMACQGLRFVSLNQIRGVSDLQFLENLQSLEMVSIYGMAAVQHLPSFAHLTSLRRFELGQMKLLDSINPALDAPNLEELHLYKFVNVTPADVSAIKSHATLRSFGWAAENVPDRVWCPVMDAITLPRTRSLHPEEWFLRRS